MIFVGDGFASTGFRRAGDVIVVANVVASADVERMLTAAASSLGQ